MSLSDQRRFPDHVKQPNRMEVRHWLKPGTERPMCNIRRGFFSEVKYASALEHTTCERCALYAGKVGK